MSTEEFDKQAPEEVKKYLQQSHDRIFENNKKWAEEQKTKNPAFFDALNAGQSPEYLWIGESGPSVGMRCFFHPFQRLAQLPL